MASSRDLVEAHSYERRRLVKAFVRGAAHDQIAQPLRAGRAILGGALLATVVLAASAVAPAVDMGELMAWHS